MLPEALDKFFRKNFFSTLFTKKKKLKVTKFKFKIICRTRVKNIPLWYSVRPSTHPPSPNRVKSLFFFAKKAERLLHEIFFCAAVTLIPYFKISFCSSATSFLKYFSNPRSELTKLQVKMVLPYYSFRIKFKDTYFYKAFWSFAVRLSRNFVEFSVKGENPTMVLEYFQINGGQILVFRKPLTSRGNLPFSQIFPK